MKREFFQPILTEQMLGVNSQMQKPVIPNIHVIIPVYNEEISIENLIKKIDTYFKGFSSYTLTIVDDGSTDNTVGVLKQLNKLKYDFDLLTYGRNRGKGYALRTGFEVCTKEEIIITMDGDGEHLPDDIYRLILPILNKTAQAVIGSRFIDNKFFKIFNPRFYGSYANNGKKHNFMRRFGNWLFSLSIWIATQKWVMDSQSGFRAFAPGVLQHLELGCNQFQIETEMTMELLKRGFNLEHVPIQTGHCGRPSYMGLFKDSAKNIFTVIRVRSPKKLRNIIAKIMPKYVKTFFNVS